MPTRAIVSGVITVKAQHIQLVSVVKPGSDTVKTVQEDADDHSFVFKAHYVQNTDNENALKLETT